MTEQTDDNGSLLEMTATIVEAYVAHNRLQVAQVPDLIASVHRSLSEAGTPQGESADIQPERAVGVRKSLSDRNHIISMIDGKPYKVLKRHLAKNGYTPDSYRETFNLPADYPMVAAAYSERRGKMAREAGLGRKPGQKVRKDQ